MKTTTACIAYILKNGNNPDNEAAVRKELGVRGFKPGAINALIESAAKIQKSPFTLARTLSSRGVRTDLSVSDMLTYAFIKDNMPLAQIYLDAERDQTADLETAKVALIDIGVPCVKCVRRIVADIVRVSGQTNRRQKNKRLTETPVAPDEDGMNDPETIESLDDPNFDASSPLTKDEDDAEQKPDTDTPGFEDIDENFFTNHD